MPARPTVIGVPTSAGAFAPGQERAPQALRDAGLLAALTDAGLTVTDRGDRAPSPWRPDRERPRAQNLPAGALERLAADLAAALGRSPALARA